MQDSYLKVFNNLFYNVEENVFVKEAIEQVSNVFGSVITKFGEIENEMTTGTSRKDNFVDTVIILFIRKIIEQLDAINVLYSIGSFETAKIILRSLIENIAGLEFILKEDTKNRASAYFLEHHYQELEKSNIYFSKDSEFAKMVIAKKGEEEYNSICEKIRKKKEALNRLIDSHEEFQIIDKARKNKLCEKKRKGKKKAYIQWYEVCSNVTSFRSLMKEIGYEQYYDAIYGGLSFEAHGLNSAMGMSIDDSGILLKKIRNADDGGSTFELACTFSIGVLNKIYQYLEDGYDEKAEFRSFFLEYKKNRDNAFQALDRICNN